MIAPVKKLQGLVLIAGILLGKLESKGSGKGLKILSEGQTGKLKIHQGMKDWWPDENLARPNAGATTPLLQKASFLNCLAFAVLLVFASRNPTIDRGMFLKGSSEARNSNPQSTDV